MNEYREGSDDLRPYLNRFAKSRTGSADIEGYYSDLDEMWVVETQNGPQALIDVASPSAELLTKTMAEQEADDERQLSLMELTTKTDAAQESDDRAPHYAAALELTTKTHAQMESDDTRRVDTSFL